MRIPRPWFRESNKTWYIQLRGRAVNLGKNKTGAHAKYRKLMSQNDAYLTIHDTSGGTSRGIVSLLLQYQHDSRA